MKAKRKKRVRKPRVDNSDSYKKRIEKVAKMVYRNRICVVCNNTITMWHHLILRQKVGYYFPDVRNLVPICADCHGKWSAVGPHSLNTLAEAAFVERFKAARPAQHVWWDTHQCDRTETLIREFGKPNWRGWLDYWTYIAENDVHPDFALRQALLAGPDEHDPDRLLALLANVVEFLGKPADILASVTDDDTLTTEGKEADE